MNLRQSPNLRIRNYVIDIIAIIFGVFLWYVPVAFFISAEHLIVYHLSILLPVAILTVYSIQWTRRYYETAIFEVGEKSATSKSGVFFKHENRIDLPKINMINLTEGPLQRRLGTKHIHFTNRSHGCSFDRSRSL